MRHVILSFAMLLTAAPASAQLHTYYEGFVRHDGKVLPATAEYAVEAGRAVAAMKGGVGTFRFIYLEKEQLLRMILDSDKQYFEFPVTEGGMTGSVMAEVEAQLEGLPPEQRKLIEEQMKKASPQASQAASAEYVMTDEMTKVLGYDCTRVNVLFGGKKSAEYWGTPSPDFKISEAERATVAGLGKALNGADAGAGGGASRAFLWDTNQDGFPLIMRCTADTAITTHLQITKFDRKPLPKELFKVPPGYKKLSLSMKDE